MESFFRTHKYLIEHLQPSVLRNLMAEINWNDRLIGIKGSRGVGKTTFLLDYARKFYGANNRECLYVNLNHFFFTERTLVDFAAEFQQRGGKVLLIDQVFKYSGWSKELRSCCVLGLVGDALERGEPRFGRQSRLLQSKGIFFSGIPEFDIREHPTLLLARRYNPSPPRGGGRDLFQGQPP